MFEKDNQRKWKFIISERVKKIDRIDFPVFNFVQLHKVFATAFWVAIRMAIVFYLYINFCSKFIFTGENKVDMMRVS